MRILVAQMARMGDMIQTSPLIRALRHKHPDAHIAAMVRKMGKVVAERNPDVDEVIVYDEDQMFVDLRAQDSDKLLRAYQTADGYVRLLKEKQFDIAYNCTNSIASAMLLKLAEVPQVVGAHLSDDWQFVLRGHWTTYFFTCVLHREYNDINLCDVFRHFAEDPPPNPELVFRIEQEDQRFLADLLEQHGIQPDHFVACLQLGASEDHKRWPEAHFAGLAQRLAEAYNARIFLVGTKEEARFGETFAQHAPGLAIPLFGKTTLPQLAALLQRANVLATNDTGTMHLAAAVRCPIVLVSVGRVHFRETGPYGSGHVAVEWRREKVGRSDWVPTAEEERTKILPDHVFRAVEVAVKHADGRSIPVLNVMPDSAQVDYHISRFAPDGFLQWYPLLRRPLTQTDFLRIAYRIMWLDFLNMEDKLDAVPIEVVMKDAERMAKGLLSEIPEEEDDRPFERESLEALLKCYASPLKTDDWPGGRELCRDFGELCILGSNGLQMALRLTRSLESNEGMAKANVLVQDLARLDEDIRLFGHLHPATAPLVAIARFERDNLEGADPLQLAWATWRIYSGLFHRASGMWLATSSVINAWLIVNAGSQTRTPEE